MDDFMSGGRNVEDETGTIPNSKEIIKYFESCQKYSELNL